MRPDLLLALYVGASLAALLVLTLHTYARRRRFEPEPTQDRIFRCRDCAFVYTDDPDVDLSRCPHCGRMNESFRF
ncbi:MAG TPA: hypothetical protein PKE47_04860 [Verrucomicrobiota bacterium]|nr:hypothetical protein [Verrucomicrobiota bacterium]